MPLPPWLASQEMNYQRGRENRQSRDDRFMAMLQSGLAGLNSLSGMYGSKLEADQAMRRENLKAGALARRDRDKTDLEREKMKAAGERSDDLIASNQFVSGRKDEAKKEADRVAKEDRDREFGRRQARDESDAARHAKDFTFKEQGRDAGLTADEAEHLQRLEYMDSPDNLISPNVAAIPGLPPHVAAGAVAKGSTRAMASQQKQANTQEKAEQSAMRYEDSQEWKERARQDRLGQSRVINFSKIVDNILPPMKPEDFTDEATAVEDHKNYELDRRKIHDTALRLSQEHPDWSLAQIQDGVMAEAGLK